MWKWDKNFDDLLNTELNKEGGHLIIYLSIWVGDKGKIKIKIRNVKEGKWLVIDVRANILDFFAIFLIEDAFLVIQN